MAIPPELTVGIPVYNEAYSVVTAIASVLNQTWSGTKEILIVDDGSTDDTVQVITAIAQRHKEIRLVRHLENQGRPAARSTLMNEARGEFFAMLDADDEWYPDKLVRQFSLLADLRVDGSVDPRKLMVCGNLHHIDKDTGEERVKNFAKAYGQQGYDIRRVLKGDNTPISQVALLKTDFMREIGAFDAQLARAQDWDFLIRFFDAGGQIDFVPGAPLAIFYFTRQGRNSALVSKCMEHVIAKHAALYEQFGLDRDSILSSIQGYIKSFEPTSMTATGGQAIA